jgi:hypothetical protein
MRRMVGNSLVTAVAALALLGPMGSPAAAEDASKYGLEAVGASLSTTQAGAHADLTASFKLTRENGEPYAKTRDIEVHLPPGVIGNPQDISRCTVAQLGNAPLESECPVASQVGVTVIRTSEPVSATLTEPLYNMPTPGGDIVARFGFFAVIYPAFINVRVDPHDYSLVASIEGAPSAAGLLEATTTIWGVPAASSHDKERLTPEEAVAGKFPAEGIEVKPSVPFLSNPTDCTLVRQITVSARSYQRPDVTSTMSAPFPAITGCTNVTFSPTFTAVPTNPEAAAPTGLDATLKIPQDETPQGLATSSLKSAVVTLPEGMSINPAAGDGLAACSDEQVGYEENKPAACPAAAKIGSAEIEVPALEHTLKGVVYQRTPVPGRLFGFWLVTDELGVHLKLPAEIQANPLTGQLKTVFAGIPSLGGNPQVPVEELRLHVFGGPRAPLATPTACGTYQTSYAFAPWSGRPASEGQTAMQISSGCDKGKVFDPGLTAGTEMSFAGRFAPFSLTLTRDDGEPNPSMIAVHLPQGLLAKLGGVPLCPDAQAAGGDCPGASQVGTLAASAGVGGAPLWIPQPGKAPTAVYLAGPYKGAPYSIVSAVPAQAGPFDLGTVVNRAAIEIDPETALATVRTDPLPQILEGVPVSYRTIHVEINRPKFTLNPTDCSQKQIRATVTAAGGRTAQATDGFQASNCAKLAYKPQLRLRFSGSTKRTGNPGVTAVLTQKPNQANTSAATVILPPSQFIDQSHINNPCTRVQFNAEACPKNSILGTATAHSSLLDKPLKGFVYFRSNGGARELPDLVVDLRGPVHITLVGFIDSVHKKGSESSRVRTRFLSVPDAPVNSFVMKLYGGKRGLIDNSKDLCRTPPRAQARLVAQNGRVKSTRQAIATSCGKKKRKKS